MKKYIIFLLIIFPVLSSAQYKKTTAVLDLKAGPGVSEMLINLINEYFGTTVGNMTEYHVVSGQALVSRLKLKVENYSQLLACRKVKCMAEVGQTLGVQKIIYGEIKKQEETFVVTLQLLDVLDNSLYTTITEKYAGDETLLGEEFDGYVTTLFDKEKAEIQRRQFKADQRKELMGKMVSGSTTKGTRFSAGAGALLLLNKGPLLFTDYLKLGLQIDRHCFLAEVQLVDEMLQDREFPYQERVKEKIEYTGITAVYGYELMKLFFGWVTVSPGITGGYVKYKYSHITEKYSDTDSTFYEAERDTASNQSYLGGNLSIEIGNQIMDHIGAATYINTKVLYLKASPIIVRIDFGLKVAFIL